MTDLMSTDEELFLNREIEWLRFDERVLREAMNTRHPLLERLKFHVIFHTNLDEFFMVRLARLLRLLEQEDDEGKGGEETFDEVSRYVRELLCIASANYHETLLPELGSHGIVLVPKSELTDDDRQLLQEHFTDEIFPILTPLAVDPAHPFPFLSNLSVYLAIHFEEVQSDGRPLLGFVEIPKALHRLVRLQSRHARHRFVLLEDVIRLHLSKLFPWTRVTGAFAFRVTRNLDYQLLEGDVKDLMKALEIELKDRAQKTVVRLEVEEGMPTELRMRLQAAFDLDPTEVYPVDMPLNMRDLNALQRLEVDPALRDEPFSPRTPPRLLEGSDIFALIRETPILLHHPFDSFGAVLEFLRQAAEDPQVLAIKQTLYRIGPNSPLTDILVRAAENGKQVTVVVELKARFDEHTNIEWARRLERSGVHVVFGFVGLKTHAKCTLVIRRENDGLRRYLHLSTGNYNHVTARLYTDLGMLTDDPHITKDIMGLFNILTGFNLLGGDATPQLTRATTASGPGFERILVAPFSLRKGIQELIEEEAKLRGHIILKMNSLIDPALIASLYEANRQGTRIDCIVRGMCALRPGLPGWSENIRVVSVIDRFLEHSRVFWFGGGGEPRVFLGSADLMPRNMQKRIEVLWPVEDPDLKHSIRELLDLYLLDNLNSHEKMPSGAYVRRQPGEEPPFRVQAHLASAASNPLLVHRGTKEAAKV